MTVPDSHAHERAAITILYMLHEAESSLLRRHVTMTTGESGTVQELNLDADHGLVFTMELYHPRKFYPVSTIKDVKV